MYGRCLPRGRGLRDRDWIPDGCDRARGPDVVDVVVDVVVDAVGTVRAPVSRREEEDVERDGQDTEKEERLGQFVHLKTVVTA